MKRLAFAFLLTTSAQAQSLYVSEQGDGVTIVDAKTLAITGHINPGGIEPRGIAITADGKFLLTANKGSGDLSVIDRATGNVTKRIAIGPSAEMVRVHAGLAFVTYEPPTDKGGLAHIAVVDLKSGTVTASVPSGHETEGLEFSADGRNMLVTNEGDDTISVYALPGGAPVKVVKMPDVGMRPRGIKRLPHGGGYAVTLEFANKFLILNKDFSIAHSVPTGEAPYGVGFDPAGTRLFVAAAKAGLLQVFDAKTYAHITDIKVGKRCWHFAFTPDGSKLAIACGRSGDLELFDATTYAPVKTLDGLKLPWGVVAYPVSSGSLQ
jgi:YVTN family beta-propeller protein